MTGTATSHIDPASADQALVEAAHQLARGDGEAAVTTIQSLAGRLVPDSDTGQDPIWPTAARDAVLVAALWAVDQSVAEDPVGPGEPLDEPTPDERVDTSGLRLDRLYDIWSLVEGLGPDHLRHRELAPALEEAMDRADRFAGAEAMRQSWREAQGQALRELS